ncbi:hypothetical protein R3W88_004666 [Solanum pinnatisectum]|uniref:Retrotransposon gag domain-containing protein n=1 Tax=Solanum pinnatisectum TaxID=50273 RepID=A0AAV9K9X9_9SOLN|nr:hypothetical protein R3W88_004666 [Solanum pinnatisectum]
MGDNNEEIGLTDVVVAHPTVTDQNELIIQLMQQIAEMQVEMQRRQDLPNPAFIFNAPADGRPPLHFPPSSAEQAQNPPSNPAQNPPIIDLTAPNPHHASVSYQEPPLPQGTNSQTFPPHQNANPQVCPTPRNQNVSNPQTFTHHQNQYTNPPTFPQNYQATQNTKNPSIAPPSHQKTPFEIPIPNEPYANCFELDHYGEHEREWRSKKEVAKLNMKEEIRKAMKELHYIPKVDGLSYEDLCIHPNLDLPEGFKVPKFDTFRGTGNPLAHLRAYCDQLVGVGRNKALLMRLFSQSLSGEALEWFTSHEIRQWSSWSALAKDFVERFAYNVEIVPDHYSLERINRKSTESYREYAYRWRKEVARVRPFTSEKEIVEVFIRIQEPEYYDKIILLIGAKFAEIVKVGEAIEDGIKTGKISRIAAPTESSGLLKKKIDDVSSISCTYNGKGHFKKSSLYKGYPRAPQNSYPVCYTQSGYQTPPTSYQALPLNYQIPPLSYQISPLVYQTLPPHYQNTHPYYQDPPVNCSNIQSSYQTPPQHYQNSPPSYRAPQYPNFQTQAPTHQNPPNHRPGPSHLGNNYYHAHPNLEKKPSRVFTPLVESRTQLFERLKSAGLIQAIDP